MSEVAAHRGGGPVRGDAPEDWRGRIDAARPTYECPRCQQPAMQFFNQLADAPDREDFFHCWACGSSFEI